jgi:pimeloyl-ACP methyl ester carboxylesterase
MRVTVTVLSILTTAALGWWLLNPWLPRGSERFYLLLPPVLLATYLVFVPEGGKLLRHQASRTCLFLGLLTAASTLYAFHLGSLLAPPAATGFFQRLSLVEVLVAVYFVVALTLVLMLPLSVLRLLVSWSRTRPPPLSEAKTPAGRRAQLRQALLEVPLVLAMVPLLLAALQIHRLKVPNPVTPRELAGRVYEDVAFQAADGLTIRGWFLPAAEPSSRTLLICHGLSANRTNFFPFVGIGDDLHANVLLFDLRGHGDSDGHTVSFGYWEKLDVLAAVDYLRRARPEQAREVIGLGVSMGASALILAAAEVEPPFDALVADSSFASAVELTDQVLSIFPAPLRALLAAPGVPLASLHAGCDLNWVRPINAIGRVRAPVLFVHAAADGLIPVEHSRRLYEATQTPKRLWVTDTGGHGSSLRDREGYRQAVLQLFDERRSPGLTGS